MGFPGSSAGKESACNSGDPSSIPGLTGEWLPTPVFLPGELHEQRSPTTVEWVAYPFLGDTANPGIEPGSPALQADSLPAELPGKLRQEMEDS